jgi:hypothetical protein
MFASYATGVTEQLRLGTGLVEELGGAGLAGGLHGRPREQLRGKVVQLFGGLVFDNISGS